MGDANGGPGTVGGLAGPSGEGHFGDEPAVSAAAYGLGAVIIAVNAWLLVQMVLL
ncbi:MAG TPA: hypothetical protein VMU93_01965 [Caulobacteraceae bacterium]|nr:hypothetical protein [Caulobacteraceae bacterium]